MPCLVLVTYPDCLVITTKGVQDVLKRGKDAWQDWDVLSAKIRAQKRDQDEEFQCLALVRQMLNNCVHNKTERPISLYSTQKSMIDACSIFK